VAAGINLLTIAYVALPPHGLAFQNAICGINRSMAYIFSIILLIVIVALAAYLIYALMHPEKF
jgi:K+-transporting ATPase KdpF subunit